MEETYFDSNEFFDLKNSFINLQRDNQLDENDNQLDVSIRISKLLLRSEKLYAENLLNYFDYIDEVKRNEWFIESNKSINVNDSERRIGTYILLNQENFFGFNYFFGFDEENGILYFLSSFGVLAVVGIRNSEDIEYQVIEARHKFIEDDKYLFVCAIGLFATENEKYFINNIDELIFNNVIRLKGM
jgi:hypothetical protein